LLPFLIINSMFLPIWLPLDVFQNQRTIPTSMVPFILIGPVVVEDREDPDPEVDRVDRVAHQTHPRVVGPVEHHIPVVDREAVDHQTLHLHRVEDRVVVNHQTLGVGPVEHRNPAVVDPEVHRNWVGVDPEEEDPVGLVEHRIPPVVPEVHRIPAVVDLEVVDHRN